MDVGPAAHRDSGTRSDPLALSDEITNAFWHACRGGQRQTAEYLLARGASLNWIGHGDQTPVQAAEEGGNDTIVAWLREIGAKRARELK